MKPNITIKEIHGLDEMAKQYKIVIQLNPNLNKEKYTTMLKDMMAHGYRMIGAFEGSNSAGIAGFWISTKIYSGKYVELDNVIVDEKYRSIGVGKKLCDWIIREAKKHGCETAMLDAYVENSGAHRFYFREGYIARGFHFLKKI